MNENEFVVMEDIELNEETFDFEALEQSLENELTSQMADLEILEKDRNMIGNPSSLGKSVMNVVWEQFINQVGVYAGEEFIKENRGLTLDLSNDAHIITIDNYGQEGVGNHNFIVQSEEFIKNNHNQTLDLSDDAHIQTTENFSQGKIATHNYKIDYQKRHDDWHSNFKHDENGNVITHKTRSGKNEATLVHGARAPFDKDRPKGSSENGTAMDHDISAAEIIRNPAANAHLTKEEQIAFANSEANLHEMNASHNSSKRDKPMTEWLDNPNSRGQKPQEIYADPMSDDYLSEELEQRYREKDAQARVEFEKRIAEGEQRSVETGKESQKEEESRSIEAGKQSQREEAIRIGNKALRAVLMGLLAELIKNIIQKLITWFRTGKKNIKSFIESIKDAIYTFVKNLKNNLLSAGKSLLKTIATAIIGPIVSTLTKVWILLKQGYKSLKEAIEYIRNSKNKPFSILMLEVGKIIIAGLTAGGALVLGEVITKGLSTIPGFSIDIGLGSLAGILGIFFGALISGIIGAIALNLIDKAVAKKQIALNTQQQIEKKNEIIQTQDKLTIATASETLNTRIKMGSNISNRHEKASESVNDFVNNIKNNITDAKKMQGENKNKIDSIKNMLNKL